MGELVDPYTFVRTVTIALATIWTVRGLWRAARFVQDWSRKLHGLGFEKAWIRRRVVGLLLRITVLDPVNLALMLALVVVWTARREL